MACGNTISVRATAIYTTIIPITATITTYIAVINVSTITGSNLTAIMTVVYIADDY